MRSSSASHPVELAEWRPPGVAAFWVFLLAALPGVAAVQFLAGSADRSPDRSSR